MVAANARLTATHAVRSAAWTRNASFEDLPRELRDMIYHDLWLQTPRICFSGLFWDNLTYDHGSASQCGLPRWLLTNKSIFQEGLKQLFVKAIWSCRGKFDLKTVQECPSIATSFATKFHLGAKKEVGSRAEPAIHYGNIIAPALTATIVSRFGPQLKHFWKSFDQNLPATTLSLLKRKWRLDLSCLDDFEGSLDSLTVSCEATRWGRHDYDTIAPGLMSAYEVETRRVGVRLVGVDATVAVKADVRVISNTTILRNETHFYIKMECRKVIPRSLGPTP